MMFRVAFICIGLVIFFLKDSCAQESQISQVLNLQVKPAFSKQNVKEEKIVAPDDIKGVLARGFSLIQESKLEQALGDFKRVIAAAPKSAWGYYGLGVCHRMMGDTAHARIQYNKALAAEPLFGNAYLEIGDLDAMASQLESAEYNFKKASKLLPDSPIPFYKLGLIRGVQEGITSGRKLFKEALERDSTFSAAHFELGKGFFFEGVFPKATAYFTTCVRLRPDFDEALLWLGISEAAKRDFTASLAHLDQYIQRDEKRPEGYSLKAFVFFYRHDYVQCMRSMHQFYQRTIQTSDFSAAYGLRRAEDFKSSIDQLMRLDGVVDSKTFDEFCEALSMYCYMSVSDAELKATTLMRKFPKVAFTHYFDGIVKSNRFNPQGALQSFTRSIELDASNTDAHKRAGLIWLDRKHYTVARTHFDQMLKYDSSNVYAYKYRAIVNTSEENFPHAIDDYSRAIALDTLGSDLYYNRASIYMSLERYEEARRDLMQVTRLKPRDYETWCEVGKVSWLLGDTLMTIQAYTASIKARKYYVDPYYLLANVYIVSRQHQKAIELMDAFLKIYPREAEGVYIVAACYYAMSDFNAALSKADALLKENPGFQRAQLLRGLCHFKLGNKQAALQEFEQLKQAGYENIDLYIRMVKQ